MSVDEVTVGFIGAGQMGMPMVRRLRAAGAPISVLARRAEVRDELAAIGVASCDDACELAASVDVLEVCLFSDAQLRSLLFNDGVAAAMKSGSVLMSHVTGSPAIYQELAAMVAPGVGVVDAPVSGTAQQIDRGDLTVLLGGSDADVARVSVVLAAFCSHIIHAGALGDGQRVKLVNNLLFALHARIAGEAIRIGEGLGIDQARLVHAVKECSGRSWALGLLENVPFAAFDGASRRYLEKDVATLVDVADELDIDLGPFAAMVGAPRRQSPEGPATTTKGRSDG